MSELELKEILQSFSQDLLENLEKKLSTSDKWMTLKEGAAYANVSYNTLMKFRLLGLHISEIDGTKRISKSAIDNFLNNNSF